MKRTVLLTFFVASICYSQSKTKDGVEITVKKVKLVDNVSVFGIRQLQVTSNMLKKVMIKTKIKSEPNNKTKLSAFSLVDKKNKIRYRLGDYKGYTGIVGFPELIPFRKTKPEDDDNPISYGPPYDETEKDYFNDYNIVGYKNFETPVNLGTKRNPKLSILYFGETSYEKFTAELFFTLMVQNIRLEYELYYKDERIADIKFLK